MKFLSYPFYNTERMWLRCLNIYKSNTLFFKLQLCKFSKESRAQAAENSKKRWYRPFHCGILIAKTFVNAAICSAANSVTVNIRGYCNEPTFKSSQFSKDRWLGRHVSDIPGDIVCRQSTNKTPEHPDYPR